MLCCGPDSDRFVGAGTTNKNIRKTFLYILYSKATEPALEHHKFFFRSGT
jgi:hypothetical protein